MPSPPEPFCFPLSQQQPGCAKTEPQSAKHPSECFPLPRVLQSQPCSNRNGQWVGSAAGEASAPVGSPSLQGPGQHRGHSCCRARPWLAWLPVHGDKVLSVRAQHVVTAHVHTDHRTQALACGQAGTKATLTEEIFFSQR